MGRPPTISRDQILDASRRRFAATGFGATTLADIAGELGVTPAAVLRHFASKQELFDTAMRPAIALPQCIVDLKTVDARTDPRIVLRAIAEGWIPFATTTISQNIAVAIHAQSRPTITLPFHPDDENSPPRRGLPIVADYFRRAHEAGVITVEDPRAAALLFMGSLIGYVFIHHVVHGMPQPYPVPDFIDALLRLWSEGGMARGGSRGKSETEAADPATGDRARRRRVDPVHTAETKAARNSAGGDAGSADGKRRVAGRRPGRTRTRR
jgi:AcrR family transcriptional regulator